MLPQEWKKRSVFQFKNRFGPRSYNVANGQDVAFQKKTNFSKKLYYLDGNLYQGNVPNQSHAVYKLLVDFVLYI